MKTLLKKTGKEIKERVDPKTTGGKWKQIQYYSGIGAGVLFALAGSSIVPQGAVIWVKIGAWIAAGIAGRSFLDKSNLTLSKK